MHIARSTIRKTLSKFVDNSMFLTGRSNPKLARDIVRILGQQLDEPISLFADGEVRIRIEHNLRRRLVFIIQPTAFPVNASIMEVVFLADAAKRASAKEVIAIIPYFSYSRQDRKEMSRVPISASAVANILINAGVDRIVTVDIHSEQQEGFIQKPWDNLYASYSLIPAIKSRKLSNLIVASPDKGGMIRATGYARRLPGSEGVALVYKERDVTLSNKSKALFMIGHVKDKNVLLVDDMIDTGSTIVDAAEFIKKKGAKSVRVAATHGLFSGSAIEKISKSTIDEVFITDTVLLPEKIVKNRKITVVTVAPLLAEAIRRIQTGESFSKDLIL